MKLVFKGKKHEAGNVHSFYFASKESISWLPGQSIRLEIETDYLAEERRFTISSAPSEKDIAITTNLSDSPFKQALGKLKKDDEIAGYNIEGNFLWPKRSRPPVLLANSLGITPFRSQIAERINVGQTVSADLIYSYPHGLEVFKTELAQWKHSHPELNAVFLSGQKLTARLVTKAIPDLNDRLIYIAGSTKFLTHTQADLIKNYGVEASNIKLDALIGL